MKNFKIISTYFRVTQVNKKETFLLIFFSLLSNVPYLFISLLFSIAIRYLTDKNIPMLLWTIIVYFALKLLSKVSQILNLMMERRFHNDVYLKLQSQIIDKLDQIKIQYFSDHSKGEMLNIANGDIKVLAEFGTWLSQEILLFVSVIVSIVVLGKISIGLMILGCVVNSTVIYILNKYNEKYEVLMREGKVALIDRDFEKIRKACKDAGIDEYIMSLPEQYDTILEEGASNFSGGQRQRLAIARALLKEAKILLLDEVTSALDVKTVSEIMETVSKLKKNHTILMISHKPGEYKWCDRIIPMEKIRARQ